MADFYIGQTLLQNWSRDVLDMQIKIKDESDNPTIGILLCKDKNNVEVEFALRDMNKPMGISQIQLVEQLPDDLKSSLPSIDELETELNKLDE